MADLCGGHPADVLIAVCLAAQTRTVPGMERAGSAAAGWAGGEGLCYLGRSRAGDPVAAEGRGREGHLRVPSGTRTWEGMAQCPLNALMDVPPDRGGTDARSLCPSVASSLLRYS